MTTARSSFSLTPFEHYMFVEDRPAYPMTFWLRLCFAGRIDVARLSAAAETALDRHWLMRACVSGEPHWRTSRLALVAPAAQPATCQDVGTGEITNARNPIDLSREPGLRLWVQHQGDGSQVLFQFHHVCSDGIGSLAFLETLFTAYHANEKASDPSATLAAFVTERQRFQQRRPSYFRRPPLDIAWVPSFLWNEPTPVASSGGSNEGVAYPFASRCLDNNTSAQLYRLARATGVTVNDWLLRDLTRVLDRWNRRHGADGLVRITIPMNMRSAATKPLSVMNDVSLAFLDHKKGAVGTDDLAYTARQTKTFKRWNRGETLLRALRWCGSIPGGLTRLMGRERCMSTAVLSNLGVVFPGATGNPVASWLQGDDLVLDRIEFYPPIRPLTRAAFGVLSYAGRLAICLHYDPFAFSQAKGQQLLDEYVEEVTKINCAGG